MNIPGLIEPEPPIDLSITAHQGDDYETTFSVLDTGEAAVLETAQVTFSVVSCEGSNAIIQKTLGNGLTDLGDGFVKLEISRADLAELVPGIYFYNVKIQDEADKITTIIRWEIFNLLSSITT